MSEVIYSLYAVSAGSLWLLSVLLFYNVPLVNIVANRWLATFYLFTGFALFQQFLNKTGFDRQAAMLVYGLEVTRWAIAPCFYIAIVHFVTPGRKSPKLLAHLIPALCFLISSLFFITPSLQNQVSWPAWPVWSGLIIRYFSSVQMIVYWVLSFRLILMHSKNIRLISSTIEKIDLFWIKQLLWGTLILTIVRLVTYRNEFSSLINPVLYCAGVLFVAIHSLTQGIIYPIVASDPDGIEAVLNKDKNADRLSSDQVLLLKSRVMAALEGKQLFLDPALTLPALSKKVGIGINELSYVINNGLGKNFYTLINEMRVEEAKKLLLSEKSKYLDKVGIAIQAGFNSKTTFNTTFKKLTGQTPTEFIRSAPNAKAAE